MSDPQQLELAKEMAQRAEEAGFSHCIKGEAVFWMEADEGLVPGHIYSAKGRKEFQISGCCEFHFDEMFADMDEEFMFEDEL